MGNAARIVRRLAHGGPGLGPEPGSGEIAVSTALLVKIRSALRSGYTAHAIAYEFGDEIDTLLGGPDEAGPLSQSSVDSVDSDDASGAPSTCPKCGADMEGLHCPKCGSRWWSTS